MTLYGENLRLFADGKCVAAALSATVHAAVQVEDATTKDSPAGWDEFEVTGKSLDITSEALACTADVREYTMIADTPLKAGGSNYMTESSGYHLLQPGDVVDIDCTEEIGICLIDEADMHTVAQVDYHQPLHYEATEEIRVYFCVYDGGYGQIAPCHVRIKTSNGLTTKDFMNMLKSSRKVYFDFTETEGEQNRSVASSAIVSGMAYVVDISLNAANKQRATYTVQLKATGEVNLPANVTGISTLSLDDDDVPPSPEEDTDGTEE